MGLGELTDAQVVGRCRAGDADAWNELVERFSRYVFAITTRAYRLSESDAEDVFQEVFARAYQHLDKLRDDEAIKPWIGQLTRRLSIDKLRAGGREDVVEELPDDAEHDPAFAKVEESLDVHRAMARLPEHCRDILDRFFAQDQSYVVIGEALGIPSGTIASRISRCLSKLRSDFEGR